MALRRKLVALSTTIALASLAACAGGSSSPTALGPLPQGTQRQVTLAFSGVTTLSAGTHTMALSGTTVTLTLNGQIIGTGTLDANGKVIIEIEKAVPAGSTIVATAGSTSISFTLAQVANDTAVQVQRNADGTLTVTVVGGDQPKAAPDPNDPDGEQEVEDAQGNPQVVVDNDGHLVLPSNLPITVTSTCTSITLTAKAGQTFSRLRFEENIHDDDGGSKLKFDGVFASPQTFPLISQSARIRIELFDAAGHQVLDVKAPVNAFTIVPGQPTPSPCPSPTASPVPTATPH